MANDTAGGGLQQLENHYKTFIVGPTSDLKIAWDYLLISIVRPNKTLLKSQVRDSTSFVSPCHIGPSKSVTMNRSYPRPLGRAYLISVLNSI